ncbi:hypothetical protein E3P81_01032 [Wallemia ichthyophaga]|nr:hypothetical protein E3P97_01033 [Wallemia ichthyophaga]TIB30846.1 hypothetical protein E3P85_02522 [Wallemia ichthyophaga]TIB49035.1 hypothetical protein E3P82_01031 [Wallemia ichthyophaga]TIB53033.1 hypothetical protein E3P81_01032 [Wallemia ichthyophaga]TIB55721.1 hypothetical protein E3P80_01032 [Wallemia ichthyophaga]
MPMTMPMTMTMESLNETEILIKHGADPMSFYEYDYESDNSSKPAWIIMHAIGMTFSFAILLPFALALKASHSSLYGLVNLLFLITISTSTAFSTIYKKLTPDLYSHSAHGKLGWFTLFLIAALSGYDSFRFLQKAWTWYKSTNYKSLNSFKVNVLEDVDRAPPSNHSQAENDNIPLYETTHLHDYDDEADSPASSDSRRSEMTLNDDQPEHLAKLNYSSLKLSWKERGLAIAHYLKLTLDRTTFPLGFAGVTTGVVSYSGICHATYLNGCLAHLIKGGIFFGYGLLTFGRYCGAYADIGWAWNLTPRRSLRNWKARCVSAEFVECLVIFTYGCTNTFMERFGAKAGDPWSMKQVQHASIAVMFFFVGGLGLLIELRSVRRLFGSYRPDQPNPNPFPALAIGITGFAMASHHQEYAFAVSQHALFGNFLALFALCRCSTYALTYLSPITSERPTKPVTELLASFFLSAGGIAFMFSIEQFTFAAYRRGFAHLMFLLNLVISLTALCIFCVALTMVVKSWSARESTGSNKGLLFDASEAGGEDDDEGVDGVDEANVHQHDRLTHTHAQSHSHDQPV